MKLSNPLPKRTSEYDQHTMSATAKGSTKTGGKNPIPTVHQSLFKGPGQ